jgi:hypothetical protein
VAGATRSRIQASGTEFWTDTRYRYEFVDQGNLPKDARASMLKNKTGVESKGWRLLHCRVQVVRGGAAQCATVDSRRSPRDMLWAPDLNEENEADDRQSVCETHA